MQAIPKPPTAIPTPLQTLGTQLRARRKALKVSAIAAAEAANMSRVTLHRIEKGEPSVTMGAWLQAAEVLNLQLGILPPPTAADAANTPTAKSGEGWIPVHIALADYPELQRLAWQINDQETLTPREALDIYERNGRHIDEAALLPHERQLMDALRTVLDTNAHGV